MVREVPVSDHVIRYTLSLVRQTRRRRAGHAGLRGRPVGLGRRAAGRAVSDRRRQGAGADATPHPCDGRRHPVLAKPVLRHRIVVNFAAESDGVTSDDIVDRLLDVHPRQRG